MNRTCFGVVACAVALYVGAAASAAPPPHSTGTSRAIQATSQNIGATRAIQATTGTGRPTRFGHVRTVTVTGAVGSNLLIGFPYSYPYHYPIQYGAYYGYAGFSPYYDPYLAALRDQNALLRRQVNLLAQQGGQDGAAQRNQQAARQRQREIRKRAGDMLVAGSRLFRSESYGRAIDRFRDATRLVPGDPTPHFLLAQALFATGKYSESADQIKRGLELAPDWLELDFDMRSLYGKEARLLPQLADLAAELKERPLDRDAMFVLGFELFVTGQKEKARTILEQTARLEPDDTHLVPFFDYFDRREAGQPEPQLNVPAAPPEPAHRNAPEAPEPYPGIDLPQ